MSRLKDLFHSRDKPKNYLININPSKKQPIPALPLALADRYFFFYHALSLAFAKTSLSISIGSSPP